MRCVIAVWVATLCAVSLADGLSDYMSPEAKAEVSRVFRPGQDLQTAEARPGRTRKPTPRPIVQSPYGNPYDRTRQPARNVPKKFRPSPEDPYFPAEGLHYAPSHKYLQKYAQQLYTAQKNAGQLSEYQKYIINQDPAVKKFVFTRVPKVAEPTPISTTVRKVVTTTPRPTTTLRPKEVVSDSSAQSTAIKYVFEPEYIPVYSRDKVAFHQTYTPTYASTAPQIVLDEHAFKVPDHKHEDYPTKEPKYEFRYEVKDPEKNSNFGHAESRKGKTTWGKYFVQLADGRFETVKYWADKTGYHAEVDYKGQARHPPAKAVGHAIPLDPTDGLNLYGPPVTHQFYEVSEHTPLEY